MYMYNLKAGCVLGCFCFYHVCKIRLNELKELQSLQFNSPIFSIQFNSIHPFFSRPSIQFNSILFLKKSVLNSELIQFTSPWMLDIHNYSEMFDFRSKWLVGLICHEKKEFFWWHWNDLEMTFQWPWYSKWLMHRQIWLFFHGMWKSS